MNRHIRARWWRLCDEYGLELFGAALFLAVCVGLPLVLGAM